MCSTAFKKSSRRILEDVRGNFAVPSGTQPETIESDELRVGMKRAAEDIARSKFVIYNFSPVFQWGRARSGTAAAAARTGACGGAGVHQRAGRAAAACLGIGGRPVMDPMPMQHLCSCVLEIICGPCVTAPVWPLPLMR